jgi:hypothetical protein
MTVNLAPLCEPVKDIPPDEPIRGISMDVYTEEEAYEVLATLKRIATTGEEEEEENDDDDDGSQTGAFF